MNNSANTTLTSSTRLTSRTSAWLQAHATFLKARFDERLEDDRGLTTLEWALISAGVAAMAIALVVVIRTKVNDTANTVPTSVNTGTTFGSN